MASATSTNWRFIEEFRGGRQICMSILVEEAEYAWLDRLEEPAKSWYHQQESNLYLALRRHSFYPLNYGGTSLGEAVIVFGGGGLPLTAKKSLSRTAR